MKIEHLAIWVDDLELMRNFYTTYFNAASNEIYHNPKRAFYSYFLSFGEGATRIELMQMPELTEPGNKRGHTKGIAHFAITVGSKQAVDELTERFRTDGYSIVGEPRTSGDGYYESVILDPEGNVVELIA